ncbi:MAG: hypothetical protein ACI9F9_003439 [Candidatus Paceibacteria bacterium]
MRLCVALRLAPMFSDLPAQVSPVPSRTGPGCDGTRPACGIEFARLTLDCRSLGCCPLSSASTRIMTRVTHLRGCRTRVPSLVRRTIRESALQVVYKHPYLRSHESCAGIDDIESAGSSAEPGEHPDQLAAVHLPLAMTLGDQG